MIPRQQTQALWLVLSLVGLVIVVVHGAGWFHLTTFRERLETELGERLLVVTRLVAATFSGEELEALDRGTALETLAARLEAARSRNGLASLTLLDADMVVLAGTSPSLRPGEHAASLEGDGREILRAWGGEASVSPTLRESEFMLKSAYAPVMNGDGVVLAVLAAEGDHDFLRLVSDFENQLLGAASVALIALLLSGGLATVALRRLMVARDLALAADKLATVGKLAAGVTHEIRNPLGTISTTCQLLQKRLGKATDDDASENVRLMGYVMEEVERLDEILERFVRFSRQAVPEMERMSLRRLLERLEGLVSRNLERRGVAFTVETFEGDPMVRGDPRQLHQVLLNCVLNGADAVQGKDGAKLRVAVKKARLDGAAAWELRVEDDGEGFDPALGETVFDAFVTGKRTGTGLGLAVVRDIVIAHGGRVTLGRSELGGASVNVLLPASEEEGRE